MFDVVNVGHHRLRSYAAGNSVFSVFIAESTAVDVSTEDIVHDIVDRYCFWQFTANVWQVNTTKSLDAATNVGSRKEHYADTLIHVDFASYRTSMKSSIHWFLMVHLTECIYNELDFYTVHKNTFGESYYSFRISSDHLRYVSNNLDYTFGSTTGKVDSAKPF